MIHTIHDLKHFIYTLYNNIKRCYNNEFNNKLELLDPDTKKPIVNIDSSRNDGTCYDLKQEIINVLKTDGVSDPEVIEEISTEALTFANRESQHPSSNLEVERRTINKLIESIVSILPKNIKKIATITLAAIVFGYVISNYSAPIGAGNFSGFNGTVNLGNNNQTGITARKFDTPNYLVHFSNPNAVAPFNNQLAIGYDQVVNNQTMRDTYEDQINPFIYANSVDNPNAIAPYNDQLAIGHTPVALRNMNTEQLKPYSDMYFNNNLAIGYNPQVQTMLGTQNPIYNQSTIKFLTEKEKQIHNLVILEQEVDQNNIFLNKLTNFISGNETVTSGELNNFLLKIFGGKLHSNLMKIYNNEIINNKNTVYLDKIKTKYNMYNSDLRKKISNLYNNIKRDIILPNDLKPYNKMFK